MYERDASGTWQRIVKLIATDGYPAAQFGYSVSIKGSRLVVGANGANAKGNASGAAYVYDRSASGKWTLFTKLVAKDGAAYDQLGRSVSMSGSRVIVSSTYDDDKGTNSGSAYEFAYDPVCTNSTTCKCKPGYTGATCSVKSP